MAANVTVPNNFVAATPAIADDVDANFTAITSWINTNAVHLDASKPFAGVPSGPATDPTTADQLTRKAYVDALTRRYGGEWTNASLTYTALQSTNVSFTAESSDSDAYAAPAFSTLTIPAGLGGIYAVTFLATYSSGVGRLRFKLTAGGVEYGTSTSEAISGNPIVTHAIVVPLAAAATIFVLGTELSSGSITISARLQVHRISA